MIRYYYTDPLAAAWMSKHFGMKIVDEFVESFQIGAWASLKMLAEAKPVNEIGWSKQYIHAESLYLLEPLIGDIVLNCDDDPARVISNGKPPEAYCVPWSSAIEHVGTSAQIISRRGKAFHWPESEEA